MEVRVIQITDTARDMLSTVLSENPGKLLRIVIDGIG